MERSEPVAEFLRDRVGLKEAKKELRCEFVDYRRARRWCVPNEREIGAKLKTLIQNLFERPESGKFQTLTTSRNRFKATAELTGLNDDGYLNGFEAP